MVPKTELLQALYSGMRGKPTSTNCSTSCCLAPHALQKVALLTAPREDLRVSDHSQTLVALPLTRGVQQYDKTKYLVMHINTCVVCIFLSPNLTMLS